MVSLRSQLPFEVVDDSSHAELSFSIAAYIFIVWGRALLRPNLIPFCEPPVVLPLSGPAAQNS